MTEAATKSYFRPDIEGLRAIAIGAVLLFHAGVPWAEGGFIGVDVFFVISGFLITGLLVREWDGNGRIDLRVFYARRFRRLLPAALLWNWRHGEQGQQEFRKAEVATYVGVGIITFIAALSYWRTTPMPEPEKAADVSGVRTIAVLPFENAGGDAEVQYLCDGIAESLINWLAGVNVQTVWLRRALST